MMTYPEIDPVALQLGPISIHWYGLMYVFGFLLVHWLSRKQLAEHGLWEKDVSREHFEGLFTWLILGVIIGGRLAYVLFYQTEYYLSHPIEVFYIWQGGMSFHGGMVGPVVAGWFYCNKYQLPFFKLLDVIFIVAPLGLALGRLGNFINGELWGRSTDVPWAMVFAHVDTLPRHPSQLYELALEGLFLFALLWWTRHRQWPEGSRFGVFLMGYAVARIFCEFFREPDEQLGFLFSFVTMGMLLSSAMFVGGLVWLWIMHRRSVSST